MARPLRIEYPGALYHITSRGNDRADIFDDDEDRKSFLKLLADNIERYNWLCHAYCLMDNHYHLLIETPDGNLCQGMRQLNGVYTRRHNVRHDRVGHVFQGRFNAIIVDKESYLLEVSRYIVLNPVRAGMVKDVSRWRWSSYSATAGIISPPRYLTVDWILGLFDGTRKTAHKRYREFVSEGILADSPWSKLTGRVLLGDAIFVGSLERYLSDNELIKEIPRSERFAHRPPLDKLFTSTRKNKAITKSERDKAIHAAHLNHGYTLKEIADHLDIHYATASRAVAAGRKG